MPDDTRDAPGELQPRDLLLASDLDPQEVEALLRRYGVTDATAADENLQSLAGEPHSRRLLAEILDEVLACAARSADPDGALNRLERLADAAVSRGELFSYLRDAPATIDVLARTLGASPFMGEILVRDPGLLYWVTDSEILASVRTRELLTHDLAELVVPLKTEEGRANALRIFKRREILHLGVRDILRQASVPQTLDALSAMAEVLIAQAVDTAAQTVAGRPPTGFAVLALGKLGGSELNFSSDVDLVYVGADDAADGGGPEAPLSSTMQRQLAQRLTRLLSDATHEGYVYRVDLRLRPEGRSGSLVVSLAAAREYYATRGATWERLALSKAWPVAGDAALGDRFLSLVEPFVYGTGLTEAAVADIRHMKELIDDKMSQRGETHTNVKLGLGGIREIELIVQTLQVGHGTRLPHVRARGTLNGLKALQGSDLLTASETEDLMGAYLFLRDLENKLQMVEDVQSHALPASDSDLRACARRLGYVSESAVADLLADYRRHTQAVNQLFRSFFEGPDVGRLITA
jgi:glutamate-ammonia-ligase adenylyltransferase